MPAVKFTLQNRITTLMIILSIIFISAFTIIQLNNQLQNINRYNVYQANISGGILRNNLEVTIRQVEQDQIPPHLQSTLRELKEANLVKETIVFDKERKIIASTESSLIGQNTSYKDLARWDTLSNPQDKDRWFTTEINRANKAVDLYIAIKLEPTGPTSYLAKSTFPFAKPQEALAAVYKPVIIAIAIVILVNILFGYMLSKTVLGPIKVLNKITKIIAEGDLTVRTNIQTNDELQELGLTFNYMTEQLIKMKERAENANPLTKLPGNIVIHEEIEKMIRGNKKFMVIYCDLDNFKAFNDKYGIAKGDEAIELTSEIFKGSLKSKGNSNDFVGHEGGDDFILITTPDKAQSIADYITSEFDKQVRNLYNSDDLSQGFIVSHGRDGSIKQFPIMTISLAGVTNEARDISSYAQVTNIAAEVKKKAKAIEGSVFVIDQRKT